MEPATPVIALDHPWALDVGRVGRKAATLAVARAAGLPVGPPGVVLTVEWSPDQVGAAHQVWQIISQDGERALVVRRSPLERGNHAERKLGSIGVVRTIASAPEFRAAVQAVHDERTAVLVQPAAEAVWRGVLHATSGQRRRPVVASIGADAPDLVCLAEIDHHGRTRQLLSPSGAELPPADLLADLARLARRVDRTFEGQHDVDWVARADGSLRLIGIRPGLRADAPPADAVVVRRPERPLNGSPTSITLALALRRAVLAPTV